MVFGHLSIAYDERVLRPRPWTVAQSRWAAELLRSAQGPATVLELCAGAGHIGLLTLAMADALAVRLVTVDVNPAGCEYTRRNAESAGLADRLDVRLGRIDAELAPEERFDVVIADPPWVPKSETGQFPADPLVAIDGGDDGLDVVRDCLRVSELHLVPGGSVVLQLGSVDQVRQIQEHLRVTESDLSVLDVRSFGQQGVLVHLAADH